MSVSLEDTIAHRQHTWLSSLLNSQTLWVLCAIILACVFLSFATDAFLTTKNLYNITRNVTFVAIIALGMTIVIITGGIDLSVGSQVALVNAVAAILMSHGVPSFAAVALMLALGALVGLAQGWFIAREKMEPFIVTLAGLSIVRGFALWLTQGYSIPINDAPAFFWLGRGDVLGFPVPALIALLVVVAGFVTLRATLYGRRVVAVGSNLEAARRVGMPSARILASVYVVSGLACAVAGLLIAARLGSGSSNAAVGFELQVIAAVVLGGTALQGGRGSMLGTVLGTLTIAVIGNGLILMHISPFFTQIVTGAIILVAIWLNTRIFNARFRLGGKK